MDKTKRKRKLSKLEEKECNEVVLNINDLPIELFMKILGYLSVKELRRVGRVCQKWYIVTRKIPVKKFKHSIDIPDWSILIKEDEYDESVLNINHLPEEVFFKIFGYRNCEDGQSTGGGCKDIPGAPIKYPRMQTAPRSWSILMKEDDEVNETHFNTHNLPEELYQKIFGYLNFEDRWRAGRVCKKWYDATRALPTKKIKVDIHAPCVPSIPTKVLKLIKILPSCITHLNINVCYISGDWSINIQDFSTAIRRRCRRLKVLILCGMIFDVCGEDFDFCFQMPTTVRVFVLQDSSFLTGRRFKYVYCDIPKIEVLDLTRCSKLFVHSDTFMFLRYLKQLRLGGCVLQGDESDYYYKTVPYYQFVDGYLAQIIMWYGQTLTILDLECSASHSFTFQNIFQICDNLTELYLCYTAINDACICYYANGVVLPQLKVICLRNSCVTTSSINALLKSCPALDHIYVGSKEIKPDLDYKECTLEKVHLAYGYEHCKHYRKVDYMSM